MNVWSHLNLAVITSIIAICCYTYLQYPECEKEYVAILKQKNHAVLEQIQQRGPTRENPVFQKKDQLDPSIILISFISRKPAILYTKTAKVSKQETYLVQNMYTLIKKNKTPALYDTKYFDNQKFHFFLNPYTAGYLVIVFSHEIPLRIMVHFFLELTVILAIIVISILLMYNYRSKRRKPILIQKKNRHKNSMPQKPNTVEEKQPYHNMSAILKMLRSGTTCDTISVTAIDHYSSKILYTYSLNTMLRLEKNEENKDETRMLQHNDILQALHNGSTILHENNTKAIIPILYNNMLFGSIYIKKEKRLSGEDIQFLKDHTLKLAHELV